MSSRNKYVVGALLAGMAIFGGSIAAAQADPTVIRLGRGPAAEEQVWLLAARPDLAPNYGKVYTVEMTFSPNTDKRYQALQAGALDISTSNTHSALYAAAADLPIKIIASVAQETSKGAHTQYVVKEDSGIDSMEDLKGKTVGVIGLRSATHFWATAALKNAGLDPDKDVTFVPLSFPSQGEGLRSGTIDAAVLVEPFASMEFAQGGIKELFNSKDGVPFDEELIVLVARKQFLEENGDAARAFLSDLKAVTDYYLAHREEARQALIDGGIIRTPAEIYLKMDDWYRTPDLRVDTELLKKAQALHMELGMSEQPADIDSVVDMSYLP